MFRTEEWHVTRECTIIITTFVMMVNNIIKRLANKSGRKKIKVIVFTDDIMIGGCKIEEVSTGTTAYEEVVWDYGIKFNIKK